MSRPQAPPGGILVLDKPRGATSHDVVQRVRRALGIREVGHTGTLDPMATGVLVVVVGEGTKLAPWLATQDKSYQATIALGVETDTLDADGREIQRVAPSRELLVELAAIATSARETCPRLHAAMGEEEQRTTQVPPAYSAIHHDGERAYARARRGETVVLPPRDVQVRRLAVVGGAPEPPGVTLAVEATKGYYVRSLARDLAAALGTVGHLSALRRTRAGCFALDEAVSLDRTPEELRERILPLSVVASRVLPVVHLTGRGALDARHGRAVAMEDMDTTDPGPHAWVDSGGCLLAVGEITGADTGPVGRVIRGFAG